MKQLTMSGALVLALGCSDGNTQTPYSPGDVTLIGERLGGHSLHLTACGAECGVVHDQCGPGAAADVILDQHGQVADVLCFEQDVVVETVAVDKVSSATAGNNTVLVLDGLDDGLDVEGDVTISGNNAVLYGDNPDVSVVGGTLHIEKNNAIARGVRILDDVTITKNNTQMSFCVIEGDLTITGNNTTLAECVVMGRVDIRGVNTVLVQNRFTQEEAIAGKNLTCHGNVRIDDVSDDLSDESELPEEVGCFESEENPEPQSAP